MEIVIKNNRTSRNSTDPDFRTLLWRTLRQGNLDGGSKRLPRQCGRTKALQEMVDSRSPPSGAYKDVLEGLRRRGSSRLTVDQWYPSVWTFLRLELSRNSPRGPVN
jgi:hypothetical protein